MTDGGPTTGGDPMSGTSPGLVDVRLLQLSLAEYRSSSAHHDELFREFALILSREASPGHEVPRRLLRLIEELNDRFGSFSAGPQADLDAALERADESIDLYYRVPPETREAVIHFAELLAAADEYCRHGELLTLAPPPAAVAFRDWFLGEFVAQIDGRPPTPWPAFATA